MICRQGSALVPGTSHGLLTWSSRMGCPGWSVLPGPGICSGYSSAPDSVCRWCYSAAFRGRTAKVQRARLERLGWWISSGIEERASVIAAAVRVELGDTGYFRAYVDGDLGDASDVASWDLVARSLPGVRFWLSTRAYGLGRELIELQGRHNVTVRLSAPRIDQRVRARSLPVSWVTRGRGNCLAKLEGGSCEDVGCRRCWDRPGWVPIYPLHGPVADWRAMERARRGVVCEG